MLESNVKDEAVTMDTFSLLFGYLSYSAEWTSLLGILMRNLLSPVALAYLPSGLSTVKVLTIR